MSCISINLKKEETLVKIEDNATEEEIIGELKIKLAELTKLYQDKKMKLSLPLVLHKNCLHCLN